MRAKHILSANSVCVCTKNVQERKIIWRPLRFLSAWHRSERTLTFGGIFVFNSNVPVNFIVLTFSSKRGMSNLPSAWLRPPARDLGFISSGVAVQSSCGSVLFHSLFKSQQGSSTEHFGGFAGLLSGMIFQNGNKTAARFMIIIQCDVWKCLKYEVLAVWIVTRALSIDLRGEGPKSDPGAHGTSPKTGSSLAHDFRLKT